MGVSVRPEPQRQNPADMWEEMVAQGMPKDAATQAVQRLMRGEIAQPLSNPAVPLPGERPRSVLGGQNIPPAATPAPVDAETARGREIARREGPEGRWFSGALGAVQGALFGFGDEIMAGMSALATGHPIKNYAVNLAHLREKERLQREQDPGTMLAGELVGGAALPIGAAASGTRTLGSMMARGAGAGALGGAIAGAGTAEGSAEERASGATRGAAAGALVGTILPPLGRGAGKVGSFAADMIGVRPVVDRISSALGRNPTPIESNPQRADRLLLEALRRDEVPVDRVQAALSVADRPVNIMDVAGENVRGLGRAAQSIPSKAKNQISDVLERRGEGQSQRVASDLERAMGMGRGDVFEKAENLIARRRKAAQPLYEKAYYETRVTPGRPADVWLHGTSRDFNEFKGGETAFGTFFTKDEGIAKYYTGGRGGNPRIIRAAIDIPKDKVADLTDPDLFERILQNSWIDESEWPAVRAAHDAGELYNQSMGSWQNELLKQAQREGYEAVDFWDTTSGHLDISRAIFDPKKARILKDGESSLGASVSQRVPRTVESDALRDAMQLPAFKAAYKRAQRIAKAEGVDLPEKIDGPMSVQAIDYVKRGLDDLIDSKMRSGGMGRTEARALRQRLDDVLEEVDAAVPAYKEARAQFAGDSRLIDALEQGRALDKMDPRQVRAALADMSEGEQEMFRFGALDALGIRLDKAADGRDLSRIIAGDDRKRQLLQSLFPNQESFARFMDEMGIERTMSETAHHVLGGSPTARIAAEQLDMVSGAIGPTMQAAQGNFMGALANIGTSGLLARARGVTEGTANALAPRLTATDAEEVRSLVQALIQAEQRAARQAARSQARAGSAGRAAGAWAGRP